MLAKGGYTYSLKLLLEKGRAEEQALAAGVPRYSARRLFRLDSWLGWMSEMWETLRT
jgi:hypothetical protein